MLFVSDPTFVHMEFVAESFASQDGDDDKIYLFFSENIEKSTGKVAVSHVARMCKVGFFVVKENIGSFTEQSSLF